jgi:hypothetical protein
MFPYPLGFHICRNHLTIKFRQNTDFLAFLVEKLIPNSARCTAMHLVIATEAGDTHDLEVSCEMTVQDIIALFLDSQPTLKAAIVNARLFLHGNELKSTQTLREAGVAHQDIVLLRYDPNLPKNQNQVGPSANHGGNVTQVWDTEIQKQIENRIR